MEFIPSNRSSVYSGEVIEPFDTLQSVVHVSSSFTTD